MTFARPVVALTGCDSSRGGSRLPLCTTPTDVTATIAIYASPDIEMNRARSVANKTDLCYRTRARLPAAEAP